VSNAPRWLIFQNSVTYADKHQLFLFVDLSFYASHTTESVGKLLDILLGLSFNEKVCMVLSLSSGANNLSSNLYIINSKKFEAILKTCQKLTVKGFTEGEARTYAKKMHKAIKYDEIKHFCGTNPYLLSFLENATNFYAYQSTVQSIIVRFLDENLDLKQEPDSISDYIVRNQLGTCIKFARCANSGAALNRSEMQTYYNTWLCKNNLMLEDEAVDAEQDEAQADEDEAQGDEDQGDQAEQNIQQQEGHEVRTKTLRWSFPTFGSVFLELIDNFIDKNTEEMVQSVCSKERCFAGYWYEGKFFQYLRESPLDVDYIPIENTNTETLMLKFSISSVVSLDSIPSSQLKVGILYELRSCHPIVDGVGYLEDAQKRKWLVFVQVSLANYEDHRKMCDIFCRHTTGRSVPKELKKMSEFVVLRILQEIVWH